MRNDFEDKNLEKKIESYRKRVNLAYNFNGAKGFIHKIAYSRQELEAAYTLVQDVYEKKGYSAPEPSGLRLSMWNAAPGCTTLVSTTGNQVLATATLFPDSELGVPMDSIFRDELLKIRGKKLSIVEVGSLASIIKNQQIVFQLYKTIFLFAELYIGADVMVIAVHPKRVLFYKALFASKQIGGVKAYPSVKNNPAVPMVINFKNIHANDSTDRSVFNMHRQFYHHIYRTPCSSIRLPDGRGAMGSWNAGLFDYFFFERTNIHQTIDPYILAKLRRYYYERTVSADESGLL